MRLASMPKPIAHIHKKRTEITANAPQLWRIRATQGNFGERDPLAHRFGLQGVSPESTHLRSGDLLASLSPLTTVRWVNSPPADSGSSGRNTRNLRSDTRSISTSLMTGLLASPPQQAAPVRMNAFFAASLVTSLLTAFGAIIAKQWLLHYSQAGEIGELEKQCRRRQKKFAGAQRWRLKAIIELLPTLLQISLLAFFIGLIDFFWSLNTTIATVVMTLSGLAFLAHVYTIVAAAKDPDCPFQTHAARGLIRLQSFLSSAIAYCRETRETLPESRNDVDLKLEKTEEADLKCECVLWTLEVADQKEALLEAARSVPSLTDDACHPILSHPAYNRLLSQMHASLISTKASGELGESSRQEAVVFGRALIHSLLPTAFNSEERGHARDTLSLAWPSATFSSLPGFEELAVIALTIDPTRSKASLIDCSNIPPPSIPLYIACLLAHSPVSEIVVRGLISTCLKVLTVPIEHIQLCAWALKTLATSDKPRSWSASEGLRIAHRSDSNVALQVIEAIKVLVPDSTHESDRSFLEVVSTLLAHLRKGSASYHAFTQPAHQLSLIQAIDHIALVKDKEPLSPLRSAAIKIMNALSQRPDLNFQNIPRFHSLRITIFADICADIRANKRSPPAIELLKITSEFVVRIQPGTEEYRAFCPYGNQWLKSITYLAFTETPRILPQQNRNKTGVVKSIRSSAQCSLQAFMERPELVAFWDADTICDVPSGYSPSRSDEERMSSDAAGALMLPLLKSWRQVADIDREHLRSHPEAVETLVAWMKAPSEDLQFESLAMVDHWSSSWFDHEDDDVHTLFMTAGLAEAVIAPWKSDASTKEAAYNARDRILDVLARHPAWWEVLISAFNSTVTTIQGLGGVEQVFQSLGSQMIRRISSIVVEMPLLEVEPASGAVKLLIPLLGYVQLEETLEDRTWLKRYPNVVKLLQFALRQSGSIGDAALKTVSSKSLVWFDHEEADLHQIFIDQGMAQALLGRLYSTRVSNQDTKIRDTILRVLLRSSPWITAFYLSMIFDGEADSGALMAHNAWLDVAQRARAIMDLHRLLMEMERKEGSQVRMDLWASDEALVVVTQYAKMDVPKAADRLLYLSFAEAVLKHRTSSALQSNTGVLHHHNSEPQCLSLAQDVPRTANPTPTIPGRRRVVHPALPEVPFEHGQGTHALATFREVYKQVLSMVE